MAVLYLHGVHRDGGGVGYGEEDGAVFSGHPTYQAECIALMKEVAPVIDTITYNHLNFGY